MRNVSAAYNERLKRGSMDIVIRVEIMDEGVVTRVLTGKTTGVVIGGDVQVDIDNAIQRRCTVDIIDPKGDLTPDYSQLASTPADSITPYGNEIRVWRGLKLVNTEALIPSDVELVSLGIFGISDVDVIDTSEAGNTIKITGYDRSRRVSRARLDAPYVIAKGTNYATAIRNLINARVPGLSYSFQTTAFTTPRLAFEVGDDPWEKAQEMAKNMGAQLYFDADGICVLRPVQDSLTLPTVWEYHEGEDATIIQLDRKLTDQFTYNRVVVTGETDDPDDPPVRGVASDDIAESPTFVGGQYGIVTKFMTSPFVRTQAQADAAAKSELERSLGGTEWVTFTAIPNPAHEAGDVISIVRKRAAVESRYIIDSFNIPLHAAGVMSVTTRKRRVP